MSDRWAGTSWVVVEVDDVAVDGEATLEFTDDGRVVGRSVVNRFFGPYRADGATLRLGPLASTMMAGSPEAMAEEQRVLAALGRDMTVEDAPVLEPADPEPAEQVLEDEGGLVLPDTVVLGTAPGSLRIRPAD